MIQLRRILLPTDFSDCSRIAQKQACALADEFGAELHTLHVLQDLATMIPEPGSALSLPQNFLLDLKDSAEKALDGLLPAEWSQSHTVKRATRIGGAATEIVKYAHEHEIDLIVMGTHGRGTLAHLFLGSVAERVVQHAGCPVLTVPGHKPAV